MRAKVSEREGRWEREGKTVLWEELNLKNNTIIMEAANQNQIFTYFFHSL